MAIGIDFFVHICRLVAMSGDRSWTDMLMGVDEVVSFEDFDVPMT